MHIDLKSNEMVTKATDSYFITDDVNIYGKLVVTNQRIYFVSKNPVHQIYNHEILPSDILEVIYIKGIKLFSRGIKVVLKQGENLHYHIKNRNEFGRLINKMY